LYGALREQLGLKLESTTALLRRPGDQVRQQACRQLKAVHKSPRQQPRVLPPGFLFVTVVAFVVVLG
jgi:hypothetical protein